MKKILFITGTRADYGKLKPLIKATEMNDSFQSSLFVTGMHLLAKYGYTANEVFKSAHENVYTFMNQVEGESMDLVLANTVTGLSRYLSENNFDMIVVHGDRVEALAAATVGALQNIFVAHIEGGEVSGTVDEVMRHAISKLSHFHFVASDTAKRRLMQLGEKNETIFKIGSPDVDVMLSKDLPTLHEAKNRYGISFEEYSIAAFHPVTTLSPEDQKYAAQVFVDVLLESGRNYIVISPNNDHGANYIFEEYERLSSSSKIHHFPSLRFEFFLTFLKNANLIIGNSSAGIHEAPIYAVPTINIGSRQNNRLFHSSIFNVGVDKEEIMRAVSNASICPTYEKSMHYGDGGSAEKFLNVLHGEIWGMEKQKYFNDLEINSD